MVKGVDEVTLPRIEQMAQLWTQNKHADGEVYTTSDVARICGFTGPRFVSRLIDSGALNGTRFCKPHWRSGRYGVSPKDLVEFMARRGIPFSRLDPDDTLGQRAVLGYLIRKLGKKISGATKRGDIFAQVGVEVGLITKAFQDPNLMRQCLGSKTDLAGITRNTAWAKFFRLLAEVIDQHTKVCLANVSSKKNK